MLCEVCQDAMTDMVVRTDSVEKAVCEACQGITHPLRWVCAGTFDEVQQWAREQHLVGSLQQIEIQAVIGVESIDNVECPIVYLVGTYANRKDWPMIRAALKTCRAKVYEVV